MQAFRLLMISPRCPIALLPLCALAFLCVSIYTRPASAIGIDVDDQVIAPGSSETDTFSVVVTLGKGADKERSLTLVIQPLVAADKTRFATALFLDEGPVTVDPKRPSRATFSIKPGESVAAPVRVSGAETVGVYTGKVQAWEDGAPTTSSKDFNIYKQGSTLGFEIVGGQTGQPYEWVAMPSRRSFPLTLENKGNALKHISVRAELGRDDGKRLEFGDRQEVTIESGGQHRFEFALSQALPESPDLYEGVLEIQERDVDLVRYFPLRVKTDLLGGITLVGPTKDRLTLTAKFAEQRVFHATLKNSANGPRLPLVLEQTQLYGEEGILKVNPAKFELPPDGGEAVVTLDFGEQRMPSSGEYSGRMTIAHESLGGQGKSFGLSLKGDYTLKRNDWYVFLGVVLGALTSVLLNVLLPRSTRRGRIGHKLSQLQAAIKAPSTETARDPASARRAREALRVDLAKVRLLAKGGLWLLGTDAGQRLTEIEQRMAQAEQAAKVLGKIDRLRMRLREGQPVSKYIAKEADIALREAEWALHAGRTDDAKQKTAEASRILEEQGSVEQAVEDLAEIIQNELPQPADGEKDLTEEPFVRNLIDQLRRAQDRKPILRNRLTDFEHRLEIVRFYLTVQEEAPPTSEEGKLVLSHLRNHLATGRGLDDARACVRHLHTKITRDHVIKAIKNGEGNIMLDTTNPKAGALVRAEFKFTNKTIDDEAKHATDITYQWDFDDGTTKAYGKSCTHFWVGRVIRRRKSFNLTLEVSGEGLTAPVKFPTENKKAECAVTIRGAFGSAETDPSLSEAFAFFGALVVAVLLGLNVQFEQLTAGGTWYAYLPAFLWGFGLDQAKNSFTTAFTTLRTAS